MTNPATPPHQPGGDYQPPANQGFGGPAQPGYPAPGPQQGYSPQQGGPQQGYDPQQGYGAPQPGPQQGFGDAPAQVPPQKKNGIGRKILGVVVAIVVAIGIYIAKDALFGDKTEDAKVGNCITADAPSGNEVKEDVSAKVVDCASAEAAYTVVGRVEGDSDVNSKACEQYFTKEDAEYAQIATTVSGKKDKGYLLCLETKKK